MRLKLIDPLLFILARATHSELARQVQYLKVENQILRSRLPKFVRVTRSERNRLLKYGKVLGASIRQLITIVHPNTFYRWLREASGHKAKPRPRKSGRPRTADEIRDLILRIARETGWGYTRILGELGKLGIGRISKTTVKNILKDHGFDPGPARGEGSWDQFLKRHAETLWACDFFSQPVWTVKGIRTFFVLFVIHVKTRQVKVLGFTRRPNHPWVTSRGRELREFFDSQPVKPTILFRDGDGKFSPGFDAVLKRATKKIEQRLAPGQ